MSNVYFNHKRKTHEVNYMEYLTLAESAYRTLYRKGTWTATKTDPAFGFYVAPDKDLHNDGEVGGSILCNRNRYNGGRGRGAGCGRGGGGRQTCHNCGNFDRFRVDCWQTGGGVCGAKDEGNDPCDSKTFPCVDPQALCCPPRGPDHRE